MRARYKAFVGLVGAVVALMFGVACHTAGAPVDAGMHPQGATVGNTTLTPGAQSTGPIGCSTVDLLNTTCVQGTTWTQVMTSAPTTTVIWQVGLSPQDVGTFTATTELETPGAQDNTGHATFSTYWSVTLNQDASTMTSPNGGPSISAYDAGSQFANADAAAAPTVAFVQVGQQLELVVSTPVVCAARTTVSYTRSALQPWVLNVDASSLSVYVGGGSVAQTYNVQTTPGNAVGCSAMTIGSQGPFACSPGADVSHVVCVIPASAGYSTGAGQVCLTGCAAGPWCEQNGFTFTDAGPG